MPLFLITLVSIHKSTNKLLMIILKLQGFIMKVVITFEVRFKHLNYSFCNTQVVPGTYLFHFLKGLVKILGFGKKTLAYCLVFITLAGYCLCFLLH